MLAAERHSSGLHRKRETSRTGHPQRIGKGNGNALHPDQNQILPFQKQRNDHPHADRGQITNGNVPSVLPPVRHAVILSRQSRAWRSRYELTEKRYEHTRSMDSIAARLT